LAAPLLPGFSLARLSPHLILRGERLPGEWPTVAVIAACFAVVVTAVGIEAAAVRLGGKYSAKKKAKTESELYN
jgi:hypothetical protein